MHRGYPTHYPKCLFEEPVGRRGKSKSLFCLCEEPAVRRGDLLEHHLSLRGARRATRQSLRGLWRLFRHFVARKDIKDGGDCFALSGLAMTIRRRGLLRHFMARNDI